MVNVSNPFRAEDDVSAPAGGIRWEDPKSATLDEVDENAARQLPAVTPGKSILKTPGAKTPGARRWNNNPNAKFRVTSPVAAKTPARTPGRSLALAKTPGRGPRTPGGSRFSQAPERVEVKAKTPRRTHHQQLMILRERPKTPGRVGPDGELVEEEPNPAAALRSLPNATQAAYWLRRSAREERAGNLDQAMSFIEQGIKRHAEPNEELVAAREALAAKMEFAELEAEAAAEAKRDPADAKRDFDDAAPSKSPAAKQLPSTPASAAKTASSTGEVSTPLSGSVVIVTPVRASPRTRDSLDCGEKVLTPVRRSARKATPQSLEPGSMASMLESTGFAYVPNEALKPNEPELDDKKAKLAKLFREDEETAAAPPPAEEEEIPALPAPEEANRAADAVVASRAASPAPAVIGNGNGTPKGNPKGTPGRMSRVTYADRTPPTEAARRISYGGVVVSSSEAAEAARTAEEARAAKDAATAMSTRQESARAGSAPVNISPRKPPRSPAGKKASALARAAVMAAAVVDPSPSGGTPAAEPALAAPSPAGSMVSPSVLMPSLPDARARRGRAKDRAVRFRARLRDGGDAPGDARARRLRFAATGSVPGEGGARSRRVRGRRFRGRRRRRGGERDARVGDGSTQAPRGCRVPGGDGPFGALPASCRASRDPVRRTSRVRVSRALARHPRGAQRRASHRHAGKARVNLPAQRLRQDDGQGDCRRRARRRRRTHRRRAKNEERGNTDGDASDADGERSRRVRGGGGARGHAGARVGLGASSFEESVLEQHARSMMVRRSDSGLGNERERPRVRVRILGTKRERVSHLARRETFSAGVAARTRALFFPSHRLSSPPPAPARPLRRLLLPPAPAHRRERLLHLDEHLGRRRSRAPILLEAKRHEILRHPRVPPRRRLRPRVLTAQHGERETSPSLPRGTLERRSSTARRGERDAS